jgi:hypothetical protein
MNSGNSGRNQRVLDRNVISDEPRSLTLLENEDESDHDRHGG